MHTKNNDIEIMMDNETDESIEELSESLLQKHQQELEEVNLFLIVLIYHIIISIK